MKQTAPDLSLSQTCVAYIDAVPAFLFFRKEMARFAFLVATALCLVAHLHADEAVEGVVSLPIFHERTYNTSLRKRDTDQVYGSYSVLFDVGTPPQQMLGVLDTGSSDIWVNGPLAPQKMSFYAEQSSTFTSRGQPFYIQYGSGMAAGTWCTDNFVIGGAKLNQQTFGIANRETAGQGVFGLGYIQDEANGFNTYPNVPLSLKLQGKIQRNIFSLYIDSYDQSSGRIVFGGVDEAKYEGEIHRVPITQRGHFYVNLAGLEVGGTIVPGSALEVLVDSGTTFCYLPRSVADGIARMYGARFDPRSNIYYVDSRDNKPDMMVRFEGADYHIPMSEMVIDSSLIIEGNPSSPYILGVVPSGGPPYILGDTFLRSVYAVFDLDDHVVGFGQASFAKNSRLVAIAGTL